MTARENKNTFHGVHFDPEQEQEPAIQPEEHLDQEVQHRFYQLLSSSFVTVF